MKNWGSLLRQGRQGECRQLGPGSLCQRTASGKGHSADTPGLLRASSTATTCAQRAAPLLLATCHKGAWSSDVKHFISPSLEPSLPRAVALLVLSLQPQSVLQRRANSFLSLLTAQGRMLCPGGAELPGSLLPGLGRGGAGVEQSIQALIVSSHSSNATVRRWFGLGDHL